MGLSGPPTGGPACFTGLNSLALNVLQTSNYAVLQSAAVIRALLNGAGWVQLYKNDFTPGPDNSLGDFLLADFSGYSPYNLAGLVPAPTKLATGVYQFTLPFAAFAVTGPTSNTIYGALVQVGGNWFGAVRFPVPIAAVSPLVFTVDLQWLDLALSVI